MVHGRSIKRESEFRCQVDVPHTHFQPPKLLSFRRYLFLLCLQKEQKGGHSLALPEERYPRTPGTTLEDVSAVVHKPWLLIKPYKVGT